MNELICNVKGHQPDISMDHWRSSCVNCYRDMIFNHKKVKWETLKWGWEK